MDLREIGRKGVDWMHLAQDRDQWRGLVNTVMYGLDTSGSGEGTVVGCYENSSEP
jgi:hypothetical protein